MVRLAQTSRRAVPRCTAGQPGQPGRVPSLAVSSGNGRSLECSSMIFSIRNCVGISSVFVPAQTTVPIFSCSSRTLVTNMAGSTRPAARFSNLPVCESRISTSSSRTKPLPPRLVPSPGNSNSIRQRSIPTARASPLAIQSVPPAPSSRPRRSTSCKTHRRPRCPDRRHFRMRLAACRTFSEHNDKSIFVCFLSNFLGFLAISDMLSAKAWREFTVELQIFLSPTGC